jgi:chromosome segregation ATPase
MILASLMHSPSLGKPAKSLNGISRIIKYLKRMAVVTFHQIINRTMLTKVLGPASLLLLLSQESIAATAWKTVVVKNPETQVDVCTASVSTAKQKIPFEISVVYQADGKTIPGIYLKLPSDPESPKASTHLVKVSSKESHPMVLIHASTSAEDQDVYWYAPRHLTQLLKLIREDNTLDIMLNPKSAAPTKLQVSLSGSSAALSQAAKCLKNKPEVIEEYLTLLNQSKSASVALAADDNGQRLLESTNLGFLEFLKTKEIDAQISALQKTNDPLLQVAKKQTATLTSKQDALNKSTGKLTAQIIEAGNNQQLLADLAASLPGLQQAQLQQEQLLNEQQKIFAPAKAQIAPLESNVARAKQQVQQMTQAISSTQNDIQQSQSFLNQLFARLQSSERSLNERRSQWGPVSFEAQRAEQEYRRFDVGIETQRRLQNDWTYQNMVQTQFNKERHLERIEFEYNNIIVESQQHATPAAVHCNNTTPGPQCDALNQRAQFLVEREKVVFQERKRLRADVQSDRWQITSIENRVRQEVESEHSQLRNRYDSAMSQLNQLRSDIDSLSADIQSIQGLQIPRTQSDLAQFQGNLSSLRSQLPGAQADLSSASSMLAAKKSELSFELLEANLTSAQKTLSDTKKQLKDNLESTARAESALKALDTSIKQLQVAVAKQTAERDAAQAALTQTETSLASYNEQKAPLEKALSDAKQELLRISDLYQELSNFFLGLLV